MQINSRCYVVLRSDLNMPDGKAAVQVGHAIDSVWSHYILATQANTSSQKVSNFNEWVQDGRKKVVLKVESNEKMDNLIAKVEAEGHEVYRIEDYGMNFFEGLTTTGFVVFPVTSEVKALKRTRVW